MVCDAHHDVRSAPGSRRRCPARDGVWWTFPALPVHARLARIWLEGWLDAQCPGKEEQAYGALVAFSELVTNSVLHGAGPITVHARLMDRRLVCEVTDRCVDLPMLLDAGPDDEHHRGLSLVDGAHRELVGAGRAGRRQDDLVPGRTRRGLSRAVDGP